MRKPLTHVSVSSIQDFQMCPLRWCYKWIDNRIPRFEPSALTIGKAIHRAFEDHFTTGVPLGDALRSLITPFESALLTEREQKSYKTLKGLCEPLDHWTDFFPVTETLEVEQAFEVPLSNSLIFQGRPDRVVLINDHVFHFQHKTIDPARDVATYIQVASRSMHELLYGDYLARKYSEHPYGGTIYNIVRKLKYRSEAKGKEDKILHEPHEFFLQTPVAIDPVLQLQAQHDLSVLSNQMRETANAYLSPIAHVPSNRRLDEDMFSRRADPYLPVLMGETTLQNDLLYMDREDLYAPEPTDDE